LYNILNRHGPIRDEKTSGKFLNFVNRVDTRLFEAIETKDSLKIAEAVSDRDEFLDYLDREHMRFSYNLMPPIPSSDYKWKWLTVWDNSTLVGHSFLVLANWFD
jgi:hypothetical protein